MTSYISCNERSRIANEQRNLKIQLVKKLFSANDDERKKTIDLMYNVIQCNKSTYNCCGNNYQDGNNILSHNKNSNNVNFTGNYDNCSSGNSFSGISYGPTVF